MHFLAASTLLASLATTASAASGVLLPLYVYPSASFGDNAANWKPAFDAIKATTNVPWLAVVNPSNGPGPTGQPGNGDANYVSGISQLNALANVQTIGYVRTDYARSPLDELKKNITTYHSWAATNKDVAVKGIFFDETSTTNFAYLKEAVDHARATFTEGPATMICNFGTTTPAEFYKVCDVVIAFESCLNCPLGSQYKSQETISNNIPKGLEPQAAIIVHHFTGTTFDGKTADNALLTNFAQTIKTNKVGWAYFCSADYNDIKSNPASIGAVAKAMA